MVREGGCFCGAVRFRAEGEPRGVTHCHCLHCRRISGAAFVTWAEYPIDRFTWTKGTPATFSSRPGVTRSFCASCGTPFTWKNDGTPRSIDVTVCTFDDPAAFKPRDHVFNDRRLPWTHLDDGLPAFPQGRTPPRS